MVISCTWEHGGKLLEAAMSIIEGGGKQATCRRLGC